MNNKREIMKVWLSLESHKKLKVLAAQRGVTMGGLVGEWIERELEEKVLK